MTKPRTTIAVTLAAALTTAAAPAAADANCADRAAPATSLQRQIDQVLARGAPGARQTSTNEKRWAREGVKLTFFRADEAHAARFSDCPPPYVCLWQDANGTGRRDASSFFHYRTYRLSAYGMPAGKRRDATSRDLRQTGRAGASLRGRGFIYWLFEFGDLPRTMNDRAVTITLVR